MFGLFLHVGVLCCYCSGSRRASCTLSECTAWNPDTADISIRLRAAGVTVRVMTRSKHSLGYRGRQAGETLPGTGCAMFFFVIAWLIDRDWCRTLSFFLSMLVMVPSLIRCWGLAIAEYDRQSIARFDSSFCPRCFVWMPTNERCHSATCSSSHQA